MTAGNPAEIVLVPAPNQVPTFMGENRAAFEATREEIAALPAEKLAIIFVSVLDTASRIVAIATLAEEHEKDFGLIAFTTGLRQRVIRHARAAAQAQYRYEGASRKVEDISAIIEELKNLRARFNADAKALVVRGILRAGQLAAVSGSQRHAKVAYDVMRLCNVFLSSWPKLEGRTALTHAEVEDAFRFAEQAEVAIGLRESRHRERDTAADVRQRAYTLMANSYDDLRRALSWVLWGSNRLDELAPPLAAQRRIGKRRKPKALAPVDVGEPP